MTGMTIKQWWQERFLMLADRWIELNQPAADGPVPADRAREMVNVAVALHAAKGHVPRSMWKYANPKWRLSQ